MARTEKPGSGKYDKFFEKGVYHCSQCGQVLYDSHAKYDSGSGWPSFYKAEESAILERPDPEDSLFDSRGVRTEVICKACGAHLGHVFDDGPEPTGRRHCINSYALQFKPK